MWPDFKCSFPDCGLDARWLYLADGRVKECIQLEELPFLSIKNFNLKIIIRTVKHQREKNRDNWNAVMRTCEEHRAEKCPWTKRRLEKTGWLPK